MPLTARKRQARQFPFPEKTGQTIPANVSDAGTNLIKRFEGCRLTAYRCSAGVLTIGWGSTQDVQENMTITQAEADERLERDIAKARASVLRLITEPLNQNQLAALTSFVFNLGGGALQRSTLRQIINRGEHDRVPDELMKWCWAGGRKLKGLILRRAAEGDLYAA